MLFSNIHDLLKKGVTLNLVLTAVAGDKIEVTILPRADTGASGAGLVPKTVTATPKELDEQLPDFMKAYAATNESLKDALDAVQASAKAVEEAARAEAAEKAKTAKSSATRPVSKASSVAKTSPGLMEDDQEAGQGEAGGCSVLEFGSSEPDEQSNAGDTAQPLLVL